MARFGQSMNGNLVLVFQNNSDLLITTNEIIQALKYMLDKYASTEPNEPILCVLDISIIPKVDDNVTLH